MRLIILAACCLLGNSLGWAGELSRYRSMEVDLLPAELLLLQAPEGDVPAVVRQPERPDPLAAVVLVHGYGQHANWPAVVRPLSEGMAAAGWTVLSLSLPPAAADEPMRSYGRHRQRALARIATAVSYLKEQGLPYIALVGQDIGAVWVLDYLSQQADDEQLLAAVAISLSLQGPIPSASSVATLLETLPYPLLDIYAERDQSSVRDSAGARKRLALAADAPYQQLQLAATDGSFSLMQSVLARRIRGYLQRMLAQLPPAEEMMMDKAPAPASQPTP